MSPANRSKTRGWWPTRTVVLAGFAGGLLGASAAPAQAQGLAVAVESYVAPYVEAGDYAGVVLLSDATGVKLERPYGREATAPRKPRDLDTRYRIGSVSKQFTAAAILLLAEDEAIDLDESVHRWFPESVSLRDVTVHQLLTHTSGVPDLYDLPDFRPLESAGATFDDVVRLVASAPLAFEPGAGYAYSNGGYMLLARLVELASEMPFDQYLERRVFRPIGMTATASEPANGPFPDQAPPYDPAGATGVQAAYPANMALIQGAGSLVSTAADLHRWLRALHDEALLEPGSWERMRTDHGNGYGYGVSVYTRGGRPVVGHDGRVAGGISDVTLFLDDGSTVVLVGNVQSGVADEMRRDLPAFLVRNTEPVARPREAWPVPRLAAEEAWVPSDADLDRFAGSYRFHPGLVVHVRQLDGRLVARANEGNDSELVPMETGVFFSRMLYANIEFQTAGETVDLVWNQSGNRWVGTRE